MLATGVTSSRMLADAGYGINVAFWQPFLARSLAYAVGIPRTQKVFGLPRVWPYTDTALG